MNNYSQNLKCLTPTSGLGGYSSACVLSDLLRQGRTASVWASGGKSACSCSFMHEEDFESPE